MGLKVCQRVGGQGSSFFIHVGFRCSIVIEFFASYTQSVLLGTPRNLDNSRPITFRVNLHLSVPYFSLNFFKVIIITLFPCCVPYIQIGGGLDVPGGLMDDR